MVKYWESEDVFFDGDQYFDHMIQDIDAAKEYITVEVYIFNADPLGNRLAAHLINAHQRGVKVQIIVDGVGSYAFFEKLHGVFAKRGIIVKMYNPLPFYHPFYGNLTSWRKLQIFLTRVWRINSRNHRKIVTVDSKIMYVGSFNFAAEHTRFMGDKKWKDMGVRVSGEHVKFTILNFKKLWKLRDYYRYKKQTKKLLHPWKHSPLRLNHSLFMKRFYYRDLLQRIHRAKERIWLTTPYFIPKRRLIRALGKAAQRGVDVRILISSKSDIYFFEMLQYFYYPYLLKKGVHVFQYTETILHAKNFIIDNWTTIGSSNLNHRSFLHDLEVDLVIQDDKNFKQIVDNFVQSTHEQEVITVDSLKRRPWWHRLLSRLFFLFKYWF